MTDPKLDACDFAYPPSNISIEDFYKRLYSVGIRVVQRYLWRGGKGATVREIAAAKNAGPGGIRIVWGYEGYPTNWRGGASQGVRDASEAAAIAAELGIPHGEPIYYAVDEDAGGMGKLDVAVAYVHAANRPDHPARPYGSYAVIEALKMPGFQTYAWSGGRVSAHTALYQWHNGQQLAGGEVDYCEIRNPEALGLTQGDNEDMTPEQLVTALKDPAVVRQLRVALGMVDSKGRGHGMTGLLSRIRRGDWAAYYDKNGKAVK